MIDEKKIAQEVDKYVNDWNLGLVASAPELSSEEISSMVLTMRNSLDYGIRRGQEMFLESLWHYAKEEPDINSERQLVCVLNDNGKMKSMVVTPARTMNWEQFRFKHSVVAWLYIDELMPEQEGEGE